MFCLSLTHSPNTKYLCVSCAVTICNVCSVPPNEDDLGYCKHCKKVQYDYAKMKWLTLCFEKISGFYSIPGQWGLILIGGRHIFLTIFRIFESFPRTNFYQIFSGQHQKACHAVLLYITSTGYIFLTSGAENDVCKDTENEEQRNAVTEIKVPQCHRMPLCQRMPQYIPQNATKCHRMSQYQRMQECHISTKCDSATKCQSATECHSAKECHRMPQCYKIPQCYKMPQCQRMPQCHKMPHNSTECHKMPHYHRMPQCHKMLQCHRMPQCRKWHNAAECHNKIMIFRMLCWKSSRTQSY